METIVALKAATVHHRAAINNLQTVVIEHIGRIMVLERRVEKLGVAQMQNSEQLAECAERIVEGVRWHNWNADLINGLQVASIEQAERVKELEVALCEVAPWLAL